MVGRTGKDEQQVLLNTFVARIKEASALSRGDYERRRQSGPRGRIDWLNCGCRSSGEMSVPLSRRNVHGLAQVGIRCRA